MHEQHCELLRRIEAFSLDTDQPTLTFVARLAKENGWSQEFSRRVVIEYKRFVFLAMVAEHIVSPSEQVDQAWHLHLTYTRSYWDQMCKQVLGGPLHHNPTLGGESETAKYRELYRQTLESYRHCFQTQPPADIWPDVDIRFGEDLQERRVNLQRNWVIPKPRWLGRWRRQTVAFALIGFGFGPLVAALNPFNWIGPDFLALYTVLFVICLAGSWIVRRSLGTPDDGQPVPSLGPYAVACLRSGRDFAAQVAIISLTQRGVIEIKQEKLGLLQSLIYVITSQHPVDPNAARIERSLHEAALKPGGLPMKAARHLSRDETLRIQNKLEELGLLESSKNTFARRLVPIWLFGPLLIFGLTKLMIGVSREKPVGFLAFACVVTAVTAIFLVVTTCRRTQRGERVLRELSQTHESLRATATTNVDELSSYHFALAVGLFGGLILSGGPYDSVQVALAREFGRYPTSTGGSGSSGGCGSGGSGGCGSGCGGGCGGCGGCGG